MRPTATCHFCCCRNVVILFLLIFSSDCFSSALLSSEEHCSQRLEGDYMVFKTSNFFSYKIKKIFWKFALIINGIKSMTYS